MFKKFMSTMLCVILVIAQIPTHLLAEIISQQPDVVSYAGATHPDPVYPEFSLACDHEAMLYGIPLGSYKGKTYSFASKKLYVESDGNHRVVTNQDGDNINVVGDTMYFTTFEGGSAYIKSLNFKNNAVSTIMTAGSDQIRNFYIINESIMMYLAGGIVYQGSLTDAVAERISPMDDVFSFLPTDSGNLYAVGELRNYVLYLDNVRLLEGVSYYSVKENHFVATVNDVIYQIPMNELRSFCADSINRKNSTKMGLLPYMREFDLYGIYNVQELLQLDNPDRDCDYCENGGDDDYDEALPLSSREDAQYKAEILPGNVGQIILNQSKILTQHKWTPKKNITAYPESDGSAIIFKAGVQQTGMPYSRGKRFKGTIYEEKQKTVVFNSGATNENQSYISLSTFDLMINTADNIIYEAAANCPQAGPLCGMDCSAFLSYSWGIKSHIGSSTLVDDPCCTKLTVGSGTGGLGVLTVGDAMINPGVHCVFISRIICSSTGVVTSIEITEETPPRTQIQLLSASKFISKYLNSGYSAYRLKTCVLSFKPNGGTVSPIVMNVVPNIAYGFAASLPTPTRSGYTFTGWYTAVTGGTRVTNSTVTGSSVLQRTLYAHWVPFTVASDIALCLIPPPAANSVKQD